MAKKEQPKPIPREKTTLRRGGSHKIEDLARPKPEASKPAPKKAPAPSDPAA